MGLIWIPLSAATEPDQSYLMTIISAPGSLLSAKSFQLKLVLCEIKRPQYFSLLAQVRNTYTITRGSLIRLLRA